MDQAVGLRKKENYEMEVHSAIPAAVSALQKPVRVMTVSSGKGGVGKSNVVINLSIALCRMGFRALILDADLGLANIDVLLGLTPKYNMSHVLNGQKKLEDVLIDGPGGVRIMPASSGIQELTRLTDDQKLLFLELLDGLETDIDMLIIDTGAGISDTVLYFNLAANERIIVVTPEPTSLTDAYALIKVLYSRHSERHFRILINSASGEAMGKSIFAKLSKVADHFLDGISLDYLGTIPHDTAVTKSVLQQRPLLEAFPEAPASKAFRQVAETICRSRPNVNQGTIQFFWKRLLNV
ncbi:MAG: MinD/ParA family protein [Deltaproteobacteria bacterium]|jgi:flagellar biosynthesis protein FlhG|nr:MinD/ParA family protein [Deltaproteobacteria bacterium]